MTDTQAAVEAARNAYMRAKDATRDARTAEATARDAWSRARIEHGRANPPEWAGKRVRGVKRVWRDSQTVRGTVTLNDAPCVRNNLRNHSPIPGEWYVASDSGATGYAFLKPATRIVWELDE